MTSITDEPKALPELVAAVAAAYFSHSHVSPAEITNVISQIATCLGSVGKHPQDMLVAEPPPPAPAAPKATAEQIRNSVTPEMIISFEDDRPYRTLKRHLRSRGLTPNEYREKWGLPRDYPMVAADYSAARAELAKSTGLSGMGAKARVAAAAQRAGADRGGSQTQGPLAGAAKRPGRAPRAAKRAVQPRKPRSSS